MAKMGANRKAIIFTESRRTQEYLKDFLEANGYGGQIVLFNGTNSDPHSRQIIDRWIEANAGTGRVSGSRTVDSRTALIEHFRDHASDDDRHGSGVRRRQSPVLLAGDQL